MLFKKYKVLKPAAKLDYPDLPKIIICDLNLELAKILADKFQNINQVEIIHGDIFSIKADGIVSPSNSFGDMSGGIDKVIDQYYQGRAQMKLTEKINREYFGELPVGMALIIKMESKKYPHLIAAPTMRVPGKLRKESINVYLATRAILSQVLRYNELNFPLLQKIIIPGLGTGVGGMDYSESATQMLMAYQNIYENKWKSIVHPAMAPFALRK